MEPKVINVSIPGGSIQFTESETVPGIIRTDICSPSNSGDILYTAGQAVAVIGVEINLDTVSRIGVWIWDGSDQATVVDSTLVQIQTRTEED